MTKLDKANAVILNYITGPLSRTEIGDSIHTILSALESAELDAKFSRAEYENAKQHGEALEARCKELIEAGNRVRNPLPDDGNFTDGYARYLKNVKAWDALVDACRLTSIPSNREAVK